MEKRSKVLLAATALATIYSIYLITYFFGSIVSADGGSEAVAGTLATALVAPHMFMFLIGAIFGWVGAIARKTWGALVAAILYSVGTCFFLVYAMFGIPILILGFIGYANQKKLNKAE